MERPSLSASVENAAQNLDVLFSAVSQMEHESRGLGEHVRIVFLRNFTIEGVDAFLKYHLYANRIRPEIAFGGYGTVGQDVLGDDALITRIDPDVIVLSLVLEELESDYGTPGWRCDSVRKYLADIFDMLATRTRATIVVNTFLLPLYPELGFALAADGSDMAAQVTSLNEFIFKHVRENTPRFCLMDWNRYLRLLGAEASLDGRYWYLSKSPFKKAFLNAYAQELSRVACALKGRAKKCLVLDCDNTLWGGVIGEDGIDGIKLDRNEYPGKAYYDFQTTVLHLVERGILLALCSKNNEEDVFDVLDNHPWCRLKRSHFAAWRINWEDKVSNLVALAEHLNLGLDSFVFVDDNRVECGMVRQMLPEVTVLEVPEKLYAYPPLVIKDGLFDTLRFTAEDKQRAKLYHSESTRRGARNAFGTVDDYLASLETIAYIHRAQPNEIPRVAQLTQKTNQFSLTTKRYSEQDIRAFMSSEDGAVFALAVKDKFGDLGLVGVLILRREDDIGKIDSFLLSCRVLSRGLESAMIVHCLEIMRSVWNISRWHAEYIPTRKNAQVADFWAVNGFIETSNIDGHKTYQMVANSSHRPIPAYISIRHC
jgi:FkbH-like protein